jgi:NifU-like protein involved in Fe-S cluster formation
MGRPSAYLHCMSAPLYNTEILRLAAALSHQQRLASPQASVERRSPTCGSRVIVDVCVDATGVLAQLGMEVRACALGQASASLVAAHAVGRQTHEMREVAQQLKALLAGETDDVTFWPGVEVLARARDYPARHASILLAFEAVAQAMSYACSSLDASAHTADADRAVSR